MSKKTNMLILQVSIVERITRGGLAIFLCLCYVKISVLLPCPLLPSEQCLSVLVPKDNSSFLCHFDKQTSARSLGSLFEIRCEAWSSSRGSE